MPPTKAAAKPRFKCDCYIGYAQRKDLPFQAVFGTGVLARIAPPDGRGPENGVQPALHRPPG